MNAERYARLVSARLQGRNPDDREENRCITGPVLEARRIVTVLREAELATCRHEASDRGRPAERWFYGGVTSGQSETAITPTETFVRFVRLSAARICWSEDGCGA